MTANSSSGEGIGQAGVLAEVPPAARFFTWSLAEGADPAPALVRLTAWAVDQHVTIGLGAPLAERLGRPLAGLSAFPGDLSLAPSTQAALWARFAHPDAGRRFDAAAALAGLLGPGLRLDEEVDAFVYQGG